MDKLKCFFIKVGIIGIIALTFVLISGGQPYLSAVNATPPMAKELTLKEALNSKTETRWQKLAGTWEGENDYIVMRLGFTVDVADKFISGWHKAIYKNGQQADMVSEDTMSINGNLTGDSTLVVNFIGGYNPKDRGIGTAAITFIDDNTIKWKVVSREGVSYIPDEIELKKINQTTGEAKNALFKNAWTVFDSKTKKQFSLERPIKDVFLALGQPKSQSLFLGSESDPGNVYYYDGLEVLAQDATEGSKGLISYIYVSGDRFVTPGNLKIGDTLEKVFGVYGPSEKPRKSENLEWHTYTLDNKKGIKNSFGVGLDDKVVKIIRISMLPSFK